MNARIVSFATVLDIVVLVGLGLGLIFAPLTLIWAFDDGFSTDLLMSWAAAVDIWLLGHGVPLSFTVPPDLADALALGGGAVLPPAWLRCQQATNSRLACTFSK